MHPEITKSDIKNFEARYKGTADEELDLLEFYEDHEGDMTNILETIILSSNEDIPRFLKFFDKKIEEGELEEMQLYK